MRPDLNQYLTANKLDCLLAFDGGVNAESIAKIWINPRLEHVVVGKGLFGQDSYASAFKDLLESCNLNKVDNS